MIRVKNSVDSHQRGGTVVTMPRPRVEDENASPPAPAPG